MAFSLPLAEAMEVVVGTFAAGIVFFLLALAWTRLNLNATWNFVAHLPAYLGKITSRTIIKGPGGMRMIVSSSGFPLETRVVRNKL